MVGSEKVALISDSHIDHPRAKLWSLHHCNLWPPPYLQLTFQAAWT